jgi:pyrimidine-specific ribonucleoside hydrolase
MAAPTPLVIDCDPGIDDAVGLALALASPEVDLLAVTTVAGNAPLELTTSNALRLLRAFGREDVPVAAGADRALVRIAIHNLQPPHGSNGLGGVDLPAATRSAGGEHAVELLARVLRDAAPRSVTIAAIGPLTNIALLLALHPELAERIDRLVIMGGSTTRGNITPVAEFNVWTDPEAAQRVLAGSGLDICLVGLDVTRQATVDDSTLGAWRATSERGSLLADMIDGYGDHGPDGWPLHDALAVAAIVDPTLIESRGAKIEVDTGAGVGRGQTICFVDPPKGKGVVLGIPAPDTDPAARPRAEVAVQMDSARFRELLLARVA